MTTQIGSNTPLNISLTTPPPIGTTTTIRLDSSAQGVFLTTQSSLTSNAPVQEQNPGCIGSIVGLCKRTWTKICNWILYVIRFFIPASPLSAINQTLQSIEQANHEHRVAMETLIARMGRPSEPPVSSLPTLSSDTLVTSGTETPETSTNSGAPRLPSKASLSMAANQRLRLLEAFETLIGLKRYITSATDSTITQDFDETVKGIKDALRKLDILALYSPEGTCEKNTRTSINEVEDLLSIEAHTKTLSRQLNPNDTV